MLLEVAVGSAEIAGEFGLGFGEVAVELSEVGEHGVALGAPRVDRSGSVVVRVSDVGEEFVAIAAEVMPHLVAGRVVCHAGS